MALPEGKKRIAISLTEKEIGIIQTVSKKARRNVSDTVALMIGNIYYLNLKKS